MIGALRYSAANACVQAGRGRLLNARLWEKLIAAEDAESILSLLGDTPYRSALQESPGDLCSVERRLRERAASRFRIALPFLRGRARELMLWLWRSFEVANLILLLRAHHGSTGGQSAPGKHLHWMDLENPSGLDWTALSRTRSVPELVERLDETQAGRPYARPLQQAWGTYERKASVYILESALRVAYYRRLHRIQNRLWGRDRRECRRLAGALVDIRNLLWVLRSRIYFGLERETILSYTLPRGDRVGSEILRLAADGAPPAETARRAWGTAVRGLDELADGPPRETLLELETLLLRHLHSEAERTFAVGTYPFHLGTVLAFGILVQAEAADLIAVLEGAAAGIPRDRVRSALQGDRR